MFCWNSHDRQLRKDSCAIFSSHVTVHVAIHSVYAQVCLSLSCRPVRIPKQRICLQALYKSSRLSLHFTMPPKKAQVQVVPQHWPCGDDLWRRHFTEEIVSATASWHNLEPKMKWTNIISCTFRRTTDGLFTFC